MEFRLRASPAVIHTLSTAYGEDPYLYLHPL